MRLPHFLVVALVVAAALASAAVAADPKKGAVAAELARLAGTWTIIGAERDGQPAAGPRGVKMTISRHGALNVHTVDGRKGGGSLTIDPGTSPSSIDYVLDYGPTKGKPLLGIYTLEGETLKICRSEPGIKRPTDFTTEEASGRMVLVLRRDKR